MYGIVSEYNECGIPDSASNKVQCLLAVIDEKESRFQFGDMTADKTIWKFKNYK